MFNILIICYNVCYVCMVNIYRERYVCEGEGEGGRGGGGEGEGGKGRGEGEGGG